MSTLPNIKPEYLDIIRETSKELNISQEDLLNFLIEKELSYSVARHQFEEDLKKAKRIKNV